MKLLRPVLYTLFALVGAFVVFLIFSTIDEYRPELKELQFTDTRTALLSDSSRLDLLIWNIGYAGLDASMDFFYDGGKQMRPTEEGVINNMKNIVRDLSPYLNYDIIMLQEVDIDSKRSYRYNQVEILKSHFHQFGTSFGKNYDVSFVPIPLKSPMGKVESGLLTFSKLTPSNVTRYSFPGNYDWPKRLFMLDRCFLVNRYPLAGGDELVIINTHNSAYDDGSIREQQMSYLREFLLTEHENGNYVIVGGDWNQTPNGFAPQFPSHRFDTVNLTYIEENYPAADWKWAFDETLPTNRRVTAPYNQATSLTTLIDCYLVSPNIDVISVGTVNKDFVSSDHQPVALQIKLIRNTVTLTSSL